MPPENILYCERSIYSTVFQGGVANAASITISRNSKNISCIKEEGGADFHSAFSQYCTLRFVDVKKNKNKKQLIKHTHTRM